MISIVFYSGFKGQTDLALAEGAYGQVLLVLPGTQAYYKLVIFLFFRCREHTPAVQQKGEDNSC